LNSSVHKTKRYAPPLKIFYEFPSFSSRSKGIAKLAITPVPHVLVT
jgi:hypothetical protein